MEALNAAYRSNGFRFVTISGERGSGKTTLIKRFCTGKKAILFSAILSTSEHELKSFSKAVSKAMYRGVRSLVDFNTFEDSFEFIIKMSEKERIILVIDEYQNLVESVLGFESLFRSFISNRFYGHNMMVVLAGTGLEPINYASSSHIHVNNLSFSEMRKEFNHMSSEDVVALYAVTGGHLSYISCVDPSKGLKENLDSSFLSSDGIMYNMPQATLKESFRNLGVYNAILSVLCNGRMRMSDIVSDSGLESSAACSTYLVNLIESGIVSKEIPFEESNSRKGEYRIIHGPIAFWYRYVQDNKSLIEFRESELYDAIVKDMDSFVSMYFSDICMQYIVENHGIFDMVPGRMGPWWDKVDDRIDIVVESDDRLSMMYCDCKYRDSLVGMSVLEELKRKAKGKNQITRSRYALFSKAGFTQELIRYAENDDDTFLISLDDICF